MLPKLTVRKYGDPCLRKKSIPVNQVGPGERLFIKALFAAMYEHKGVGLAAPQVGVNQQIFVVDTGESGPLVIVNPKITKKTGTHKLEEGCLSIPGISISVNRAKTIWVEYTDENNQVVEREMTDLLARVYQHESDHLNGKLIIDYASLTKKAKIKKQLDELKKDSQHG